MDRIRHIEGGLLCARERVRNRDREDEDVHFYSCLRGNLVRRYDYQL